MTPLLITGAAGFIGFHLTRRLLSSGRSVVGLDDLNDYYDPALKQARLDQLKEFEGFRFIKADIADADAIGAAFAAEGFETVFHLAAQAGVRYSLLNPKSYVRNNLDGFANVLEACRRHAVRHLVYASSSSVYGANTALPFSTHAAADHPVSLYGATKRANELMAHSYAHMFGLPSTGLRFFTVYGSWYRPDMALSIFTKAILAGEPIKMFNHGAMRRDFTYVDDVVEAMVRLGDLPPTFDAGWDGSVPNPARSPAPWRLLNVGNNQPVELRRFVEILENLLGRPAEKLWLPMQPGDVPVTYADIDDLKSLTGFRPATPIEEGMAEFVTWHRKHYGT